MTDLPPVEYLEQSAGFAGYESWKEAFERASAATRTSIVEHAKSLHQLAQAHAEIAALKPRETLEQVARREAKGECFVEVHQDIFVEGFLRGVQMERDGGLPDE